MRHASAVSCVHCLYWQPSEPITVGDCRRHPPIVDFDGSERVSAWPVTNFDDWCGEFSPDPEDTQETDES